MKTLTLTLTLTAVLAAVPAFAGSTCKATAPQPAPDVQALNLLTEIREPAADAAEHAARLESLGWQTAIDWSTHAGHLEEIKADINDMGRQLKELEGLRAQATPVEREVIERTGTLLREMAANTTSAIQFLNATPRQLVTRSYQAYLTNLVNESERLSDTVSHFVEFARLSDKERSLRKTLDNAPAE